MRPVLGIMGNHVRVGNQPLTSTDPGSSEHLHLVVDDDGYLRAVSEQDYAEGMRDLKRTNDQARSDVSETTPHPTGV